MSFEFKPDSQQPIPEAVPPRERVGRFSIAIGAAFLVLLVVWTAWTPVTGAVKSAWGRRCAREARLAIESQEWSRAVERTIAARRWAPEDVEVIRAIIEFLKVTGSDPGGLAQQLRLLAEKQPLTEEEQILLGRTLAATGKTAEARAVYQELPAAAGDQAPALELLSGILRQEGHEDEARELARRATMRAPETPEARLKLALEDARSHFGEIRRRAHDELLQIARMQTEIAMEAIAHLSASPLLTLPEARELLDITGRHAHQKLPVRLGVVSALMRLQPEKRDALLDAEMQRFQGGEDGALEHIARWLALEKQHGRLLRLVPADLAAKSRELYPIIAQALAVEERWQELREMLTTGRPPVSQARIAIWLAEASSHLEPDLKEASRLLEGSIAASAKEGHLPNLLSAAIVAEKLHLADIALTACLAGAVKDGDAALPMLQKAHELAMRQKNTHALLQVARRLHEIRPASAAYASRLAYLRLVLGEEIEHFSIEQQPEQEGAGAPLPAITVERIPAALLRALAAHRLGDLARAQEHLAQLTEPSALPAGPRAVVAGLLALGGRADRAFEIAEKVPAALLLPEEKVFLSHAR